MQAAIGEIYSTKSGVIVKWEYDIKNMHYIGIDSTNHGKQKRNYCFGNGFFSNYSDKLKQATPEEKHWLNTCIKASKFISKEEALKTFNNKYYEVYN